MDNYQLTKKAASDISHIYEYGILTFGLSQAQDYLLTLYDRLNRLSKNPLVGQDASELTPQLRRLPFQSHVIFYLPNSEYITIVRVLRKEMDFKLHL